jgi:hypothetical protein
MSTSPIDRCAFLHVRCCNNGGPVWFCVDCDTSLCEPCWPQLLSHSNGRTGRDGLPHEKVKRDVYEKLKHILDPMYTEAELEELHRQKFGHNVVRLVSCASLVLSSPVDVRF